MVDNFKIIVITPENIVKDEVARIIKLLESGAVWRVHIRHPYASRMQLQQLLSQLPVSLYGKISLHDCFDLLNEYDGLGIHLNSRNQLPNVNIITTISKSCHSVAEVMSCNYDYVTLSPIFDSISKTGYRSSFNLEDKSLQGALMHKKVIALGGVMPQSFQTLKQVGFAGAALLGYVWSDDENEFENRIETIKQHICCNS